MRFKKVYSNPPAYYLNGREVTRQEFEAAEREAAASRIELTTNASAANVLIPGEHWRKHESTTAGCPPQQVSEFREFITDNKLVGCEVTEKGDMKFSSRLARERYLAARGLRPSERGEGPAGGRRRRRS